MQTTQQITNSIKQLKFSFSQFTFHLIAKQPISLPAYKGSVFRGGFGHAFKKVCCVSQERKYCNDCQLNTSCAYAYIFETPQTNSVKAPINSTNLPHPFIILPPSDEKQIFQPGETITFKFTLIGKGIDFLPYFVYTFDELGRMGIGQHRGRYQLDQVTANPENNTIYTCVTQTLTANFTIHHFTDPVTETKNWNPQKIQLEFITPTRITQKNRLTDKLPFELFIRNLLRRASLLAQVHCDQNWNLDYKSILELASSKVTTTQNSLHWLDWERYSKRQHQSMKLGGFVGKVCYEGELAPFLPLIYLGQHIHLGKNTSFGMGNYSVPSKL